MATRLCSRQVKHFSSSSTRYRGRNLFEIYTHPSKPTKTAQLQSSEPSQSLSDEFITTSTQPVATSFQTVPNPKDIAAKDGAHKEPPLPAMLPLSTTLPSSLPPPKLVQGVYIPPKPQPPGEEECCMSGCVHCVYTIFSDEMEEYKEALEQAKKALVKAGTPRSDWPDELREGKVEEVKMPEVDPSLAAFLALEGKLKGKT